MDFDLDPEQRELRDTARRFLEREASVAYARAMMDDERGYTDDVWKQMSALGWLSMALPEEHGGLGLGPIALSILAIEMGRVALPGPFLPTTLAALAIVDAASDELRARLLPGFATGAITGAFSYGGSVDHREGSLHGTSPCVANGGTADVVVVVARTETGGDALFVSEPSTRAGVTLIDPAARHADLAFDAAPAEKLGDGVARAMDRGALLHAAELAGLAERSLELAVDYAKERRQFDRPIGSFQAVKHRAADMLVDVDSIRNAVYYAAWALERGTYEAPLAIATAKAFASEAAVRVTRGALQIHGGIGFTWEHDLHLYLKRAALSAELYGTAAAHRERVARFVANKSGR